ncbi:serine/threonine kinase [Aureococcus anophagefferens]|nr:serine/threonine kinase [Aureococcus anophagefferens]
MRSSTFWNLLKGSSKERHPSPTTVTKTPLTNSVSPPASPKTSDADSDDARSSSCASTTKPPEPDEAKKSHRRLHSDPERFSRGKKRARGLCGAHAGDVLEPLTEPLMGEGHPLKLDAANPPENDAPHRVDAVEDAGAAAGPRSGNARRAPEAWRRDLRAVSLLGQGSFGKVHLVTDGDEQYALKSVATASLATEKKREHARSERLALELLRGHANVLTLLGAWRAPGALHIVTECAWGGELFRHLQRKKRFEPAEARFIVAELSSALVHAHGHRVAYRDVKPENVLFDARGHYMAPEVLNRVDYGGNVDWWALGMLTAELVTGLPPWYTEDRVELFRRVRYAPLQARYLVAPDKLASGDPLARDTAYFVEALLKRDAKARLADDELAAHSFFTELCGNDFAKLASLEPPFNPMRDDGGEGVVLVDERAAPPPLPPRKVSVDGASEPPPPPPPPALLGSSAALRRNFEIDGDRLCLTADEIALEVASGGAPRRPSAGSPPAPRTTSPPGNTPP